MLKNFLLIAVRNLFKTKTNSLINILGLSVGIAVVILIGLWVSDELSYDKNNPKYEEIAIVKQNVTNNGEIQTYSNTPYPLADELRRNYGENFKYIVPATWATPLILAYEEKKLTTNGAFFDVQAPDLLDLTMVEGNKEGLKDPNSVFLSQSVATAYFGDVNPMGKVMKIDNRMSVKVTGVYKDVVSNSSFNAIGFIAPWELLVNTEGFNKMPNPWRRNSFLVYVMLADNAKMSDVSNKIRDAKLKNVDKEEAEHKPELFLFPMKKWHLYSDFKDGKNVGGRIEFVWLFGIIGIIVLFMACINFMNLSTARSAKRAVEVGIRKSIGSLKWQLVIQFFLESILVTFLAFFLAILWAILMLPLFNEVADKKMNILWTSPLFWLICLCFCFLTGIIAGSYPALYLSSFRPIKVLKGTFKAAPGAGLFRRIMVIIQFTSSIVLIIGAIIVFKQIGFVRDRPIGYSLSNLIIIPTGTLDIHNHFNSVKNELINSGAVVEMAESGNSTTVIRSTNSGFDWQGKDPGLSVDFPTPEVSHDYGKTVGWKFLAGRDFSLQYPTDSTSVVLNEAAVKFMGFKNPVGEIIRWDGRPYRVIGIIKDMVVESPYEPVRPAIYHLTNDPTDFGFVYLKLNPTKSASESLSKIGPIFKSYNPTQPFEYQFADAEFSKKFGDEERTGKLAGFFAILAIFISCLGLFGMASFVAEQRVKEIGVRKLLGASVFNLWRLLAKEFILLASISILIALPVAYFYMHKWLQNYHYRTDISFWILFYTSVGVMFIILTTVSYHTIRVSLSNPTKSLRTE